MISNASPWDNLKFDAEGITEVQRKFFRALFNTYNFFALPRLGRHDLCARLAGPASAID